MVYNVGDHKLTPINYLMLLEVHYHGLASIASDYEVIVAACPPIADRA